MAYIDGFVMAVPEANKDAFVEHAAKFDTVLKEMGALRIVECWADDVPHGETTDFYCAVAAKPGEVIVFSWVEWPDKATREMAMEKVMSHPVMQGDAGEMPFDGQRMIFGSFSPVFEI